MPHNSDPGVALPPPHSPRPILRSLFHRLVAPAWRPFVWRWVRLAAIASFDSAAVIVALLIVAKQNGSEIAQIVAQSGTVMLLFAAICLGIFVVSGVYNRSWRFLSFGDGIAVGLVVFFALSIAWIACLIAFPSFRAEWPTLVPFAAIHGALVLVFMIAMRVLRRALRRYFQNHRAFHRSGHSEHPNRALLLGKKDWARAMIDLIQYGAEKQVQIIGIMTLDGRDERLRLAGVPILGTVEDLEKIVLELDKQGNKPNCVVLQDNLTQLPEDDFKRLAALVNRLGMVLARAHDPWDETARSTKRIDLEYLPLADLMGRSEIKLERGTVDCVMAGRTVLVTGAGGTIGGELVRQLAIYGAKEIVLLDHAEYSLYMIDMEMREQFPDITFHTALCSVRQREALFGVFEQHRPEIVFHAAALKHVPLVEANPGAGVHTNVIGTRNVADAVCEFGSHAMVQVSTDKAVNPVGIMGASKRIGELYCQALDLVGETDPNSPRFLTVRFGNVLGSSGSIIPLFQKQLASGQPLTVTDPDIERFFMTVQEAVQLILTSSSRALETSFRRGTIFVLDMGKPVKIVDLAKRIIRSAGMEPEVDVKIEFIGLRPGEKLFEELFDESEERFESKLPGIFQARPFPISLPTMLKRIIELEMLIRIRDFDKMKERVHALVDLSSNAKSFDRKKDVSGAKLWNFGSAGLPKPKLNGHNDGITTPNLARDI